MTYASLWTPISSDLKTKINGRINTWSTLVLWTNSTWNHLLIKIKEINTATNTFTVHFIQSKTSWGTPILQPCEFDKKMEIENDKVIFSWANLSKYDCQNFLLFNPDGSRANIS